MHGHWRSNTFFNIRKFCFSFLLSMKIKLQQHIEFSNAWRNDLLADHAHSKYGGIQRKGWEEQRDNVAKGTGWEGGFLPANGEKSKLGKLKWKEGKKERMEGQIEGFGTGDKKWTRWLKVREGERVDFEGRRDGIVEVLVVRRDHQREIINTNEDNGAKRRTSDGMKLDGKAHLIHPGRKLFASL